MGFLIAFTVDKAYLEISLGGRELDVRQLSNALGEGKVA